MNDNISKRIKEILYDYVSVKSTTYTADEKNATKYLTELFKAMDYFRENPDKYGTLEIEGDPFDRSVFYGMVRGKGNRTVVMIHHYDVVDVEDFKLMKDMAYSPDELEASLMKIRGSFSDEARTDMESEEFMFGRGTADMKGGGAIQIALLEAFSQQQEPQGNLIVLAVPDEENASAGMLAGVGLLRELKQKHGLEYLMMINSEPHQRKHPDRGVFSTGTVGKIMPFVYVRGYLSHVGKVFEGFNPVGLMNEIVRRTELNMDFADSIEGECSPPPTWLSLKDSKTHYDVSMPLSISGFFSVLTLTKTPTEIMDMLRGICEEAFDHVIASMNESYECFCREAEPVVKHLPWKKDVMDFSRLYERACSENERFAADFAEYSRQVAGMIKEGGIDTSDGNLKLVEFMFDYISDMSPCVVFGIIPPFYPSVWEGADYCAGSSGRLAEHLQNFTKEQFGQEYEKELFYTGICDLSYSGTGNYERIEEMLRNNMPFFGSFYSIPFEDISEISMPCINIGPWGKDFHKLTERVSRQDLFCRTPAILEEAINTLLIQK
ncbi:MAG: M20/M25/M40 family metallo-hydrolase [Bacillota bacterium]|nr:M20/M25/M40 family metallo-hydrolase [Bacillota bacterium]